MTALSLHNPSGDVSKDGDAVSEANNGMGRSLSTLDPLNMCACCHGNASAVRSTWSEDVTTP